MVAAGVLVVALRLDVVFVVALGLDVVLVRLDVVLVVALGLDVVLVVMRFVHSWTDLAAAASVMVPPGQAWQATAPEFNSHRTSCISSLSLPFDTPA